MTSDDTRIEYFVVALAEVLDGSQPALAARVKERLAAFPCRRSLHLEKFARTEVHKFERHGHSKTYVFLTPAGEDDIDVPAFFTVGMTSLDLSKASKSKQKKFSGDVSLSVTGAYSIAELARADTYSAAQLPGATILSEANFVIRRAREYVAGRFLVVDAQRVVFEKLYGPAGFSEITTAKAPNDMVGAQFVTACSKISDWASI